MDAVVDSPARTGPLVLIADRVEPRPHLANFVELVRRANAELSESQQIGYVVCPDYRSVALALKRHDRQIRLVLVGPGLEGRGDMLARLLGNDVPVVVALDPSKPLADTLEETRRRLVCLRDMGRFLVPVSDATTEFWAPLIRDHVVSGLVTNADLASLTPEQRTEMLDKRLESVTAFPSLPDTQRRVSELDDLDPPAKWAEAIDPDVPVRTVILNLLNSAHYGFRYRVESIEQAVSLASARAIREIVLACTVQKLFRRITEARVDQFWQHSIATAWFARLFGLPADAEKGAPDDRAELERFALEEDALALARTLRLWETFEFRKDVDAFTAGMLHDIGKVTMALCFEDSLLLIDPIAEEGVRSADERGEIWAESTRTIERSLMKDMDHAIIGGRIAKRWHVPEKLRQVIARHHDAGESAPLLVNLVALADLAANCVHSYPVLPKHAPLVRLLGRIDEAVKSGGGAPVEVARGMLAGQLSGELDRILPQLEVSPWLWTLVDRTEFFTLCYRVGPRIRALTREFLRMTSTVG